MEQLTGWLQGKEKYLKESLLIVRSVVPAAKGTMDMSHDRLCKELMTSINYYTHE